MSSLSSLMLLPGGLSDRSRGVGRRGHPRLSLAWRDVRHPATRAADRNAGVAAADAIQSYRRCMLAALPRESAAVSGVTPSFHPGNRKNATHHTTTRTSPTYIFKDNDLSQPLLQGTTERKWKPTLSHWFVRLCHERGLLQRLFTQNIDGLDFHTGALLLQHLMWKSSTHTVLTDDWLQVFRRT